MLPILGAVYLCLAATRQPASVGGLALAFGIAQHASGHAWIYAALVDKAGLPVPFAVLATAIFVLYLALFMALPSVFWARFLLRAPAVGASCDMLSAVALAALWAFGEWMRSACLGSVSSLALAYAWLDTPLEGLMPLGGMHGLGLFVYLIGFGAGPALSRLKARQPRQATALGMLLVCALALGQWGRSMPWIDAEGATMDFRLVQTGIPQRDKFDPDSAGRIVRQLTATMASSPAALVVAPETAFPMFFHQLPMGIVDTLVQFTRRSGSHLFVGVAHMGSQLRGHNSLLHVAPGSAPLSFHHKVLLMPFGEYGPRGFDWFSGRLNMAFKDLVPGPVDQPAFDVGDHRIGTMICHEDSVGWFVRQRALDASVLLNPSNLAWFDHSKAIPQGLAMVRVRALENGRPVLRVANTGITAHVDHRGRLIGSLPPYVAAELKGEVQPTKGTTPYALTGDWPFVAACLTMLLAIGLRGQKCRRV